MARKNDPRVPRSAPPAGRPDPDGDAPKRARPARKVPRAKASQEAACLDEPYQPRLPIMIRAELRELAELYLADDLEWWRAFRPEVFE